MSAIVSIAGVYVAYLIYVKKSIASFTPISVQRFFLSGWNFDKLYDIMFVKPFVRISELNKSDIIDKFFDSFGEIFNKISTPITYFQNGKLSWYLTGIVVGLIIVLTLMICL
jgi:NADH-quinone oxidoreductase subunit L